MHYVVLDNYKIVSLDTWKTRFKKKHTYLVAGTREECQSYLADKALALVAKE